MTETKLPEFGTAPIPAEKRGEAAPNPFDGKFPADENALTLTLAVPLKDPQNKDKEHPTLVTLRNQARRAAVKVDRTARVQYVAGEKSTAKNPSTVATFWTRPKISRPRTDDATNDAASQPTGDATGSATGDVNKDG